MIIRLTIDRFEGGQTVLVASDGQMIVWPKNQLPPNSREGSALNFEILEEREREIKDKQTAKEILNEIIGQP
ncbi:MAG: DUF3006 domain-containing protein [Patescibacteria group bacterium]|nr:DUF3006 domain-containing protein [Patescibacteria group bacterium]